MQLCCFDRWTSPQTLRRIKASLEIKYSVFIYSEFKNPFVLTSESLQLCVERITKLSLSLCQSQLFPRFLSTTKRKPALKDSSFMKICTFAWSAASQPLPAAPTCTKCFQEEPSGKLESIPALCPFSHSFPLPLLICTHTKAVKMQKCLTIPQAFSLCINFSVAPLSD